MFANDENLQVIYEVANAFDRLGVAYAVGGSVTSSLWGKPRFTADADVMADPFPGKEAAFCASFGSNYYVSLPAVQEAVRHRSSFNIIDTVSGYKIDVFVRKERPFEKSAITRRQSHQLTEAADQTVVVVSPEDIVLLKLEWYRLGGESSDRQWSDILGVLQAQAERLDQAYLDQWAVDLGVTDLLAKARQAATL